MVLSFSVLPEYKVWKTLLIDFQQDNHIEQSSDYFQIGPASVCSQVDALSHPFV